MVVRDTYKSTGDRLRMRYLAFRCVSLRQPKHSAGIKYECPSGFLPDLIRQNYLLSGACPPPESAVTECLLATCPGDSKNYAIRRDYAAFTVLAPLAVPHGWKPTLPVTPAQIQYSAKSEIFVFPETSDKFSRSHVI